MTQIGASLFNAGTISTAKTGASADFTADPGYTYEIDLATGTPSSNLVVTLPTAGVEQGDAVGVVLTSEDGTYGVAIAGKVHGITVADGGPLMLLNTGDCILLRYVDAAVGWTIVGGNIETEVVLSISATPVSARDAGVWKSTVYLCNATGGAITVTLPPASEWRRKRITVKKVDSSVNAVTVDGDAAETIDGAATQSLASQYDAQTYMSDGTAIHIVASV